ncbi:hypothetical protein A3860_07330 [Niastella vici]|uniref:Uncharacterized protein n=1 Tax=Niastella vici TaxID=1703345 RepID=A0A1V9FIG1_9BACT|nr:hypothetical protein [Niastella vici]OQP58130.1 hypothetical protein A3860_07330 [Niastella vici]
MPKLIGSLQFIGSLDNMSAYKMRGSDKIILRKKGGPSKKQIKQDPHFDLTRRNNKEFGGRSKLAAQIKNALFPLRSLTDYNITGPLNALLKHIQKLDTENEYGKRNVLISKNPRLLEGFTLNRKNLLESIISTPFLWSLQKDQVIIDVPGLLPGINFIVPGDYSWYQFTAVAGLVPDLYYHEHGYRPKDDRVHFRDLAYSDWLPVNTPSPAGKLIVTGLPEQKPENCSLMIAVGIAFGTIQRGEIEQVKYVGAGKVIGMV